MTPPLERWVDKRRSETRYVSMIRVQGVLLPHSVLYTQPGVKCE